jgi:hypothetical protein
MGVLITPPKFVVVSTTLRSALPLHSVVRLVEGTQLVADGEQMVVYERGNQYEPHSHIAVVKNGQRIADFSLTSLFEKEGGGDTYALVRASQFAASDQRNVSLAAFRNIGDGAGTLFVLVRERDGKYEVGWRKGASQARLKVLRNGKVQLWASDEGDDCVWCAHHYEVSTLEWRAGNLFEVSHYETENALSPYAIAANPIVIEK